MFKKIKVPSQRGDMFGAVQVLEKTKQVKTYVSSFYDRWLRPYSGKHLPGDVAKYIASINPEYKNTIEYFTFHNAENLRSVFKVPDKESFMKQYITNLSSKENN